jgi:hypothetical protein
VHLNFNTKGMFVGHGLSMFPKNLEGQSYGAGRPSRYCVWESKPRFGHPDTQAIFTSVASFNALTKSDTIPQVSQPFPSRATSRLFPEHTTVIGQYYFWFDRFLQGQ